MRRLRHITLTLLFCVILCCTAHAGPTCDPALLKQANAGDVNVQSLVAHIYASDKGGESNFHKARYWYQRIIAERKADAKLLGHANLILGLMYTHGKGGERDYDNALHCFKQAAQQGYYDAHLSIGKLYIQGLGVEKDYNKARDWLLIAANKGHREAQKLSYLLEKELTKSRQLQTTLNVFN
ncbi:MAG: TPR repeat protein [Desulforhopalus sp.]|jgi:TPR repeat protein